MKKKKLVFVILNYKTFEDTIGLSLEILELAIPDSIILIVDNYSPNESYIKLQNAFDNIQTVEVIQSNENGGYAKGNNYGLRYIKKYNPEYVCIINNDVHFSKEAICQLIQDVESNNKIGALSPIQKLPNGENAPFANLNLNTFIDDLISYIRPVCHSRIKYKATEPDGRLMKVGIVPGAFIFMKYSIAESIDFFDESTFLYCEERFLAKRLDQTGLGCYIDTSISYIHAHSNTINKEKTYVQQMKLILESRRLFIERYSRMGWLKSYIIKIVGQINIVAKGVYYKLK